MTRYVTITNTDAFSPDHIYDTYRRSFVEEVRDSQMQRRLDELNSRNVAQPHPKWAEDNSVIYLYRFINLNEHTVDYGEPGDWEVCSYQKYLDICDYIADGKSYEVRVSYPGNAEPSISYLSALQQYKFDRNKHKPHPTFIRGGSSLRSYDGDHPNELLMGLHREVFELGQALATEDYNNAQYECADIANFAAFIAYNISQVQGYVATKSAPRTLSGVTPLPHLPPRGSGIFTSHPLLPHWRDESASHRLLQQWLDDRQLETCTRTLDLDDPDLMELYVNERITPEEVADRWSPKPPSHEWVLLFMTDSDDGPVAVFARDIAFSQRTATPDD